MQEPVVLKGFYDCKVITFVITYFTKNSTTVVYVESAPLLKCWHSNFEIPSHFVASSG